MTSRMAPYLTFDSNAHDAMEFHHSVFGGTLNVTTFAEFGGGSGDVPPDGVMHAMLETECLRPRASTPSTWSSATPALCPARTG